MANQVIQLKDGSNNLYPNPNIVGINVNDVIATINYSDSQGFSYTATKDCVMYYGSGKGINLKIDNVRLDPNYTNAETFVFYLKKGQVFSLEDNAGSTGVDRKNGRVYGLKYV